MPRVTRPLSPKAASLIVKANQPERHRLLSIDPRHTRQRRAESKSLSRLPPGGTATNAYLVYLYNQSGVNQLAAILPSTLAAGNYNVSSH